MNTLSFLYLSKVMILIPDHSLDLNVAELDLLKVLPHRVHIKLQLRLE